MSSSLKDAVRNCIDAQGGGDGFFATSIDALTLMRASGESLPRHMLYRPALCVVAQGAKQVVFGDETFDYAEMQYLVVSVELPILGRVAKARAEAPFLGLNLDFDVGAIREVIEQLEAPPRSSGDPGPGVFVGDLDGPLADGILRLIRLLETPKAIPVVYPAIMREIYFWLLTGAHGGEVAKLALPGGHTQRIAKAIRFLRDDFTRPVRVEELAAAASMSPSSFHQHFKALTSMTPLQYQKNLRLLEARRLMLADAVTATNAAYQVGYESASQFSREYARMFGAPPRRDVSEMRTAPA
jgi:AraC-like DNA-binding protein